MITALKNGQEMGLKHYMDMFGPSLRYFAFNMVKEKNLAEEIVSDSFVKLWQGRHRINSESNIKAFLYIATKNACVDAIRCEKQTFLHDDDLLNELMSPNQDILSKIIQLELIESIVREIEKLPKQQAAIFKMAYFQNKCTSEICKELETSPATIYFAKSKALSTLRRKLGLVSRKSYSKLIILFIYFFFSSVR